MTISEAAENGTYRDLLVALRDHLARVIDDKCAARDLVGLSRRLLDITLELERLDARERPPSLRVVEIDGTFDPTAV